MIFSSPPKKREERSSISRQNKKRVFFLFFLWRLILLDSIIGNMWKLVSGNVLLSLFLLASAFKFDSGFGRSLSSTPNLLNHDFQSLTHGPRRIHFFGDRFHSYLLVIFCTFVGFNFVYLQGEENHNPSFDNLISCVESVLFELWYLCIVYFFGLRGFGEKRKE